MKFRRSAAAAAALATMTLAAAGCSASAGGATSTASSTGSQGSHYGGTFTALWSSAGASIDPGADYDQNWSVLSVTNDGLVGWRKVGGTAGNQMVPDLATSIPKPTDGGREYTFTVRKGIEYSTGQPVEASDFAAELRRQFEIPGPGVSFYSDIIGGQGCIDHPKSCNLSQGIVTNDKTGTISFHLTQPDPEFLQKLTLSFAYALPADTPVNTGSKPLPATGPYEIASYNPNTEMVLVRNPHFHLWSQAAQPNGYPNKIIIQYGLSLEDETTEVENGQADWMFDTPPADRLGQIGSQYSKQIHINAGDTLYYFSLNSNVAPFNNVKVRQAVNYAVNRKAVITLFGGNALATPSCQNLPPDFPGYEPYCPYTQNPGTRWTAPNLAKAKQLIAASGTSGESVKVLSDSDATSQGIGLYFVSLLSQLGYKASLETMSDSVAYTYSQDSSNKVQAYLTSWQPDYQGPADALVYTSCSGYTPNSSASPNISEFCEPQIQRLTEQAENVEVTSSARADEIWAQVDKQITSQAANLQLFVANDVAFVSTSVGNFQYNYNANEGFLFDQAWVK
jgi:peptide/nickel transport system substrate-binding protein